MPYPPAYMGFVGFVKFITGNNIFTVRASSADLKLQQAIDKPDLVTGKYDRTVYKLGPKEVEGAITFPAIMENAIDAASGTTAAVPELWRKAVVRNAGRLNNIEDIIVKYTSDNATFDFQNNLINTFDFSVTQSELVEITVNVIGVSRKSLVPSTFIGGSNYANEPQYNTRNSRAVTWNDAIVEVINGGDTLLNGSWVRTFTASVNNNADRFYTMNGKLEPQDVAPKVRDIGGTLNIMGRHILSNGDGLASLAESNSTRCSEDKYVRFGYSLSTGCRAEFIVRLPGCIFEIETMTLTNDLLESAINWHSLPGVRFTNELGDETFIESVI